MIRLCPLLSALLVGCTLAPALHSEPQTLSWCDSPRAPLSDDWVMLTDVLIVPVRPSEVSSARAMLSDRSAIALTGNQVQRLAVSASQVHSGPAYLVRGGLIIPRRLSDDEGYAWFRDPRNFLRAHWSPRHRAVAIITVNSVSERPRSMDAPLIFQSSVRPEAAYAACSSAS